MKRVRTRRSAVLPWGLAGILALALLAALLWRWGGTDGISDAADPAAEMSAAEAEDVFSIPDSVR